MSVLVYAESWDGEFKKSTFEAVSYASETAKILGEDVIACSFDEISDDELKRLGEYGASKVFHIDSINKADNQSSSKILDQLSSESSIIIFSNTYTAKMIAPRMSIRINASCITNVTSLIQSKENISVKRQSFSNKAVEISTSKLDKTILCISPNSHGLIENKTDCVIETIQSSEKGDIIIESQEISTGKVSLSDADIIVSAGRGLKGPENWTMIEELADSLGAATACSKPVSDIGWRPHAEHVGQTGKVVAPNLYIAIGISGAIQHLAGVNSSKVMVAINTDAEAPFFKAADYGIVGDAFDVVPKLIEEIKKIKN